MVKDFCEMYLRGNYDYCFSVHNDRAHMHGHIIFNSVNRVSGYKYRYVDGDWEKEIQPITDTLCRKYGLKELVYEKENRKGKSYAEHLAEKEGRITNKMIIQADMDTAIRYANDFDAFLEELRGWAIPSGLDIRRNCRVNTCRFWPQALKEPGGATGWETGIGWQISGAGW
ncbi:MAG: relaxase/mobilization nuclease domain-containing protein [Eisenbergiella sp.]